MSPETALQILDQATSQAKLTRAEHTAVLDAVQTLRDAITPTVPAAGNDQPQPSLRPV